MNKRNKLFLLVGWVFVIVLASFIDFGVIPEAVRKTIQFKNGCIGHFGAYFFASYLIWASFESLKTMVWGLNSSLVFLCIILEYGQKVIPSRTFNKVDVFMNLAGIFCFNLGLIFFLFVRKRKKR